MPFAFRLDHIALEVRDLAASARFYGEVIGLPEIENRTGRPTIRWFAFDGRRAIHLIAGADAAAPERPLNAHFCLSTPHFEAALAELARRGVRYRNLHGEPMTFNYRGDRVRQTYFQDPDNYWIEICEAEADGSVGPGSGAA